jgi:methionyl-tRNA formyltransferase
VVTPPDRPRGRGRKLGSPPAADAARELGIDLLQVASVNEEEALATIDRRRPEALCVCEFGQLIKEPLLSRCLMLNVHPSLLPRWRGATPIERALMEGDTETGVTIFRIEAGLDSGPIAVAAPEPVQPDDTAGTLSARLAPLAGTLLIEALDRAEAGTLELHEQEDDGATYASKLEPEDRRLDPRRPAIELERRVRALTPHVGTYVPLPGGERLGVSAAKAIDDAIPAGELRAVDGRVLLGAGDGALELLELRPAGKRTMSAAEYVRGHRLPERVATE